MATSVTSPPRVSAAKPSEIQAGPPATHVVWKWLVPIGLGVVLRLIPAPAGLAPLAWHYFALFAAVIAALVTEPLPGAAVGLIGISIAAAYMLIGKTPAEAVKWALSGFANDTVWLIVAANIFAIGYEVTGLGRRIALLLVKALGRRTLGLGYAIAFSDLVLAPFMPSNTARSGGTIYPVVKNIPPLYGSLPDQEPRKIGSYLMWTGFATTCITSSMFLTALAPNLLALELVKKIAKVDITWTAWVLGFLPVGIILFLATPLLTYIVYPPTVKRGDEVMRWAKMELGLLGRISRNEIIMALLAIAALIGWIGGGRWVAPVTVAFCVISAMLLTKVISWAQIAGNKQAWTVLIWFATLVAMADGLNSVGFLKWFAGRATGYLSHFSPLAIMLVVVALFFVIHYLFASLTAHTAAVLPVFLAAVLVVPGMPIRQVALLMCYSLGLMGILTPYATGPGPIWYASGYLPAKDFWRMGFLTGLFFLVVLLAVGMPYVMRFAH
jgi:L-tartrate/succinate antiporter